MRTARARVNLGVHIDARRSTKAGMLLCPCHSGRTPDECCARFLAADADEAPSPEALMRSRFTAFVRRDAEHLARTLHPDADGYPEGAAAIARAFAKEGRRTVYRKLTVLDVSAWDDSPGAEGRVLFAADVRRRGKDVSFVEDSTFVRTDIGWRYLAGVLRSCRALRGARIDIDSLTFDTFRNACATVPG